MGLFAYLNYDTPTDNKAIAQTLINALKTLALRGYDSVGVGFPEPTSDGSKLLVFKNAGSVDKLAAQMNAAHIPEKELRNNVAIAHTRWATHGVVSDQNAHPFPSDANNEFIVCLNGMIRNYAELKESLTSKGITFETETDTEVVAKLIKSTWEHNKTIPFGGLIRNVAKSLEGAFALAVMSTHYPNELVTTCYGSPLFLGVNMYDKSPPAEHKKKGAIGRTESKSSLFELARTPSSANINRAEYFVSSSEQALSSYTPTCIQMQDGDLLHFRNGRYQYYNTREDKVVERANRPTQKTGTLDVAVDKGKYAHFMLKEIHEQSESIVNVLRGRVDFEKNTVKLGGIEQHVDEIRFARRMVFIASASSLNAAIAVRGIMEELTGLAITIEFSTDFMDRLPSIERNDVCVFVSQSGETADVIKALEYCRKAHALCIGVTNTVGSPLSKNTDCGIYLNCGVEVGVASTKVYTSEIVALILLALKLGENTVATQARRVEIIQALKALPELVTKALAKEAQVANIAAKIKDHSSVLVMGRGWNYATCAEGALKLKEVSSMHSEGVLSGELKHGPLALVDETMPIVFVATKDNNYDQVINSFSQVTARSGAPIILCTEGDNRVSEKFDRIEMPPIIDCLQVVVNIIPLQLLSYHVALLRGIDVDFSKNLVKVVNV